MMQIDSWLKKIEKKLREKKAETLFEVVVSLALFSLLALMVASMFGMADKSTLKNLMTDQAFDAAVTDIVTEQKLEPEQTVDQEIIFYCADGSSVVTHPIERIKTGGFYKFREDH